MVPPAEAQSTRSGIQRLSNGEGVIPSSTRADGSVRKEIRIKPGYRPPEDVEVYKNRTTEAWKNRGKGGVPGAASVGAEESSSPQAAAAAAKNAKRREARKKAAMAASEGRNGAEDGESSVSGAEKAAVGHERAVPEATTSISEELDSEAEKIKEARKLTKKLRQARDLKDKKENGDNLLPEQFAKVIKINELIRQLDGLGFDAQGEKKHKETEPAG